MKQYDDNCAEIENSLPLYVGGDLESPAMDEVASHLAECSACSGREEAARAARELMVSALVMSERKGPALWPGVRAGLVREGILQPEAALATPRAPRRLRLVPYAAAAAALLIGFWLARDAFDGGGPYGNGPDVPAQPIADNRPGPAPRVALTAPALPVVANADALRLVGPNEHRLREGAEIYSDLHPDAVLRGNDETWTAPVINLRH
jgi:hypothetical protein